MRAYARRAALGPLALLVPMLAASGGAVGEESAEVARATAVVGDVTLQRGGGERSVRVGTGLVVGDVVVTAGGARARLAFVDGSSVVLGGLSRLAVREYVPRERGVLGLLGGILRATVGALGPDASFEIVTDTGVASVRGTEWIVDASPASTAVFVEQGRVAVTGTGPAAGGVVLGSGEGTTVLAGAAPTPPARWAAARVADVRARTALR